MNWTSGYIADLDYTYGYYRELSPGFLRFACLAAGVLPPEQEGLRYLELGYGQGLSINIHAAAVCGDFWGTDFNPSQAATAQALAAASGANAKLLDDSFAELAARSDLPEFDIIGLHGIWTWISDESRHVIVDLLRRKLRVGGIVYISYNCLPGMAPLLPLRHLLHLHASTAGSNERGLLGKVDGALGFAKKLASAGALYFRDNPRVGERLDKIAAKDRNYVAHEYFNSEWGVMPFSDLAQWLEPAKVTFAASANLLQHVDPINLSPEGMALLKDITSPLLRESVRDYLVNQQFRKDIFIKGGRRLSRLDSQARLGKESVVLVWPADDIPLTVVGPGGTATLQEAIYRPLIDALIENGQGPISLAELFDKLAPRSITWHQLVEAMLILMGEGYVHQAQQPTQEARERCARLNRYLCEDARSGGKFEFLASPITGGGFPISRFPQLFLLAAQQGRKSVGELADFAWEVVATQGETILNEGRALKTAEDSIAELTKTATGFTEKALPILKAIGVA